MRQEPESTRRTTNARTSGRAARVVKSVLTATAQELSRVGFAGLRIEDVATRSGVNKTTIYRRWPTKEKLVAALILGHASYVDRILDVVLAGAGAGAASAKR